MPQKQKIDATGVLGILILGFLLISSFWRPLNLSLPVFLLFLLGLFLLVNFGFRRLGEKSVFSFITKVRATNKLARANIEALLAPWFKNKSVKFWGKCFGSLDLKGKIGSYKFIVRLRPNGLINYEHKPFSHVEFLELRFLNSEFMDENRQQVLLEKLQKTLGANQMIAIAEDGVVWRSAPSHEAFQKLPSALGVLS